MRHATRYGSTLLLGAALALAACGGNKDAAGSAGDVAATPGMTDSSAMSAAPVAPAAVDAATIAALSDADAMALISVSNAGEIATSNLAIEKATSADVKSFAQDMVTDHQALQKQADVLAIRHDAVAEANGAARDKKAMADQMMAQLNATAQGPAFDRAYMEGQVQAHQRTVAELQALSNHQNAPIKQLATASLPKVQAHLERAQKLVASMGTTP